MKRLPLQNKKIVMLLTNDFTFDSRVLKEALSASKAGMKVFVIAKKSPKTRSAEKFEAIKIIRVQTFFDKFKEKLEKNQTKSSRPIEIKSTNLIFSLLVILNNYLFNKKLLKKALKIKPDLVHANDSDTLLAGYWLKKKGFKLVYDAHELYSESKISPHFLWKIYFKSIEKKAFLTDGVFSVNRSILDELKKRYKTTDNSAILYNCPPRTIINLKPKSQNKFVYVGNYSSGRDISKIIKAIRGISNCSLTIIGPGWPEKKEGNIIYRSPVSPKELVREISQYDIGIIPYVANNLNQYYSTPNKLFEYMMAGLAIAGSDLPEIKKILIESECGITFNPNSLKDTERSFQKLVNSSELVKKFKENSLKNSKKFSWALQGKKQIKIYKNILIK